MPPAVARSRGGLYLPDSMGKSQNAGKVVRVPAGGDESISGKMVLVDTTGCRAARHLGEWYFFVAHKDILAELETEHE